MLHAGGWWIGLAAGLTSGGLIVGAGRLPLLGWLALAPLGVAMLTAAPLPVALAAGLTGALACAATVWTPTLRSIVPLAAVSGAVGWAIPFGVLAWLLPPAQPGWLLAALPLAAVLATLPARAVGAPRWSGNALACTQERWLIVVHTVHLGGDLVVTATLAAAGALLALLAHDGAPLLLLAAGIAGIAAVLGSGWLSLRRAKRQSTAGTRVRVAAVVADGAPPRDGALTGLRPAESPDFRDVEASARRYAPLIERAAAQGARLIVLPEVSVYLNAATRPRWLEQVQAWAREHDVAIVAPYFNAELPRNELAVVDASGIVGAYEKQHPGRNLEPARGQRMEVGPHRVRAAADILQLSTAICVDLDYADIARSARAAGAVLAAPSNDWFDGFEQLHHRTAVWAAVSAGVPIVRATGHGISSIYDAAGRVVAQQSSEHGPVVLVADIHVHTEQ